MCHIGPNREDVTDVESEAHVGRLVGTFTTGLRGLRVPWGRPVIAEPFTRRETNELLCLKGSQVLFCVASELY